MPVCRSRTSAPRRIMNRQRHNLATRDELLQAIAHGSAAAWAQLNLFGEDDFSEDKLHDPVGIKPPNPLRPSLSIQEHGRTLGHAASFLVPCLAFRPRNFQ